MRKRWLSEKIRFIGKVSFDDESHKVFVKIDTDLVLNVFLPDRRLLLDSKIPRGVEGEVGEWHIRVKDIFHYSYGNPFPFNDLISEFGLTKDEIDALPAKQRKEHWWHLTMLPGIVEFSNKDIMETRPDEFGVALYPEKASKGVYNIIHEGSPCCRRMPRIFAGVDSSLSLKNRQTWTINEFLQRIDLITSSLTLFAGRRVTYSYLIARYNDEEVFVRVKDAHNPKAFVCPANYSGVVVLKPTSVDNFKHSFLKRIDKLYISKVNCKSCIIFHYFEECYHALYLETRIAFCFQLIEALSKLKGLRLSNSPRKSVLEKLLEEHSANMCASCRDIIKWNIRTDNAVFIDYLRSAIDSVFDSDNFRLNPNLLIEIMKTIRNNVFHGDFFTKADNINALIEGLPEGYREDLGEVLQATVAAIAAHILLDIEFDELTAIKRKTCDDPEYE